MVYGFPSTQGSSSSNTCKIRHCHRSVVIPAERDNLKGCMEKRFVLPSFYGEKRRRQGRSGGDWELIK